MPMNNWNNSVKILSTFVFNKACHILFAFFEIDITYCNTLRLVKLVLMTVFCVCFLIPHFRTLCLLVSSADNFCKQSGPRSDPTKRRV